MGLGRFVLVFLLSLFGIRGPSYCNFLASTVWTMNALKGHLVLKLRGRNLTVIARSPWFGPGTSNSRPKQPPEFAVRGVVAWPGPSTQTCGTYPKPYLRFLIQKP